MQVVVGTMTEPIIGSGATVFIYLSGTVAGALVTTIADSRIYLIGASAAVYAILAAYIVLVIFNNSSKSKTYCWLTVAFVIVFCDTFLAVSEEYRKNSLLNLSIAYTAHFGGMVTDDEASNIGRIASRRGMELANFFHWGLHFLYL
uniref:Rhomboid domain-containing protein n=1 Tax=Syphacia muris TaxID=451379 RepID=A0A0N5AE25_9BILA